MSEPNNPATANQNKPDAKPPSDQGFHGKPQSNDPAQGSKTDQEQASKAVSGNAERASGDGSKASGTPDYNEDKQGYYASLKYPAGDPRNQTVELKVTPTGWRGSEIFVEFSNDDYDGITGTLDANDLEPDDQNYDINQETTLTVTNAGASKMFSNADFSNATPKVSQEEAGTESQQSTEV